MAQYYASTSRSNHASAVSSSQAPVFDEGELNRSIYIFPNPSSLQDSGRSRSSSISLSLSPSSPFSPASAFSGTSDYEWPSPSRHASSSATVSRVARARTTSVSTAADADEIEVEVWNWEDSESSSGSQNLDSDIVRRSRWEMLGTTRISTDSTSTPSNMSFTTLSSLTPSPSTASLKSPLRGHVHRPSVNSLRSSRSYISQIQRYESPAPHPAIRIPLLSFLSSFLSIDESTIHILRHSPSTSVLFPDLPRRYPSDAYALEDDRPRPVHGILKLSLTSAEEDGHSGALVRGLNVMYEKDEAERAEEDADWVVWRWMRWAVGA